MRNANKLTSGQQMTHMKCIFIKAVKLALIALIMLSGPALAQNNEATPKAQTPILMLDNLFAQLKAAPDATEANRISALIWQQWLNPRDPTLSALMGDALVAKRLGNGERTLDLLAEITTTYPTYAEGWNLRATLHFELGNYSQSLEDITETLKHEPRHFGALSGRALIYLALDETAKAREAILEARQVHPFIAQNPPFNTLVEPMLRT